MCVVHGGFGLIWISIKTFGALFKKKSEHLLFDMGMV